MPNVPSPPTIGSGTSSASQFQQTSDCLRFLMTPPLARIRQNAAQTLTTSVLTPLNFQVNDYDSDVDGIPGHSTSSNISRWVARYSGWYWVAGGCTFTANATGVRSLEFAVNGISVPGSGVQVVPTAAAYIKVTARSLPIFLVSGDYLELMAFQNSGGNLDTVVGDATGQANMSLHWISN